MTRDDLIKEIHAIAGVDLLSARMMVSSITHYGVGREYFIRYHINNKHLALYSVYDTYAITTKLDDLNEDEITFIKMNEGTELVTHEHFLSKLKEIMDAEQNNT
jgi:hypothetical protein